MKNITLIISISSVVISLISLGFAIRVNRIFHRREIQKKQIDLVLKLIADFQEKPVWIKRVNGSASKHGGFMHFESGNLFTIAKRQEGQTTKQLFDLYVFFSEETTKRLKVFEYLLNPLLPKRISESLKIAFEKDLRHFELPDLSMEFYIYIDESRFLDAKAKNENDPYQGQQYLCSYQVKLEDFIRGMNLLQESINKWLKEVGVKDLNILWGN